MAPTLTQWQQLMSSYKMSSLAQYLRPHMKHVLHQCSKHGFSPDLYGLFRRAPLRPAYQQLVQQSVYTTLLGGGGLASSEEDEGLEPLHSQDVERYSAAFRKFAESFHNVYGVDMNMVGEPAQTADGRSVITYTNNPKSGAQHTWTQNDLEVDEDQDLAELLRHMKHSMCQEIRPQAEVTSASETSIPHQNPSLGEQVVLRCYYRVGDAEEHEDIPQGEGATLKSLDL